MKRVLLMGLVISAAAVGITLGKTTRASSDDLVITESVDLGVVEENGLIKHRLHAINTLRQAVTVTNVRASCGCLAPKVACGTAEPGQQILVDIEIDARQRTGAQQFQVRADTDRGSVLWTIRGIIASQPYIVPTEKHILLSPVEKQGRVEFSIVALSRHGVPEAQCRMGGASVVMACKHTTGNTGSDALHHYTVSCELELMLDQQLVAGEVLVRFKGSAYELHARVLCKRQPTVSISPSPVVVRDGEAGDITILFDCCEGFVLEGLRLPDGSQVPVGSKQGSLCLTSRQLGGPGAIGSVQLNVSGGRTEELPFLVLTQ